MQEKNSYILTVLIGLLPLSLLTFGYASTIFYLIVVSSLIVVFSRPGSFAIIKDDFSRYRGMAICLSSMMLVVLLIMVLDQIMLGSALERSFRIFGGMFLVLGACLMIKPEWLRQATWGFGLGALTSGGVCWWLSMPGFIRPDVPEYNAVSYGNLLLMITTVTAFSFGWKLTPFPQAEKFAKLIMVLAGVSGFVLTQTRSGWLATPFFIFFAILCFKNKYSIKKLLTILTLSFAALITLFSTNKTLVTRAEYAASEFKECLNNPLSFTSTCVRIQLWRASWELFKDRPLLGTRGGQHFNVNLKPLIEKGIVNQQVFEQGFGEPHNDLFYMMASYGSLGLISLLLIYFSPAYLFFRRLHKNYSQDIRIAAAMGLCVCIGFFISGLTETMFRGMRTMGFYAVTIAWLLALSDPVFIRRESRLDNSAQVHS